MSTPRDVAAHPTAVEIVDALGRSVLRLVVDGGGGRAIREVAIHDPAGPSRPGSLLLAPGVTADDLPELLAAVASAGHPAIVCRAPVPAGDALLRAAREHGTTVLELAAGADWTRLADDVRAVATAWSPARPDTADGPPADDLFALLDAASVLLDAPIVLEDTALAVLAWSGRQDEADQERVTGILERRAPGWLVDALEARGDFARLAASDEPLFLGPASSHAKPRMAVAVRFGGELLGYLWATTTGEPFGPERSADFTAVAGAVAAFLRRHGKGERPATTDLVSALLHGADPDDAAQRLGVRTAKLTVLVARSAAAVEPDESWAERRRVLDPLTLHLAIGHPRAVTTFDGNAACALLPWPSSMTAAAALAGTKRLAEGFARRAGRDGDLVLAIGSVASSPDEVAAAKEEADLVLRTLADHPSAPGVATFTDIQATFALSASVRALARAGHRLRGPVDVLAGHDAGQRTELVPTLRAYLDLFGDVKRAADRVHVHPNTFRNRLRRIHELTGFDVTDPETRFLAELEFRLRDLRPR
ncbi:PucR family transcriptional regulator [Amycolatopsis sp. NPDC058986]|uniref:PucR family transcriptional regulator n=1 Tax=unclassified Amycolatopsis TaxID=2618356 RepID=UPI00366A65BC